MNNTDKTPEPGAPLDCGHTCPERPQTGASGYARTQSGRIICYACADEHERESIAAAGIAGEPFTGFLSMDGRTLTTWTGGTLAVVRDVNSTEAWTPTGGRGERVSTRLVTPDGRRWYGRGPGRGMYHTIRPNKS